MLRPLLACLLLSSGVLLAGCAAAYKAAPDGATETAPAPLTNAFCSPSGESSYSFFELKPDVPVDYLSLRSEHRDSTRWDATTDHQRGVICATATDPVACKKKVDDLRTLTEQCGTFAPEHGCFVYYFVATRGDEVVVASELEEIKALIGRVDDPNEAMTLATRGGRYQSTCGAKDVPAAWSAVEDGYELDLQRVDCTSDEPSALIRFKARVHVHADGRIEELSATEISRGVEPNACITALTR